MINQKNLENNLPTKIIGKTILVYDSVESTNDLLKPIMTDPQYNGLVVFAKFQRKGKGRENRSWIAPANSSILCSTLIFLPGKLTDHAGPIALAAPIAAAKSIINTFQLEAKIKWPNDIYIENKKISGILIESTCVNTSLASFIIGIGINVNQKSKDFPQKIPAASISQFVNRKIDQEEFLLLSRELLIQMDQTLATITKKDYSQLRHDWLTLAGGQNHPVIVTRKNQTIKARIIDIDHTDNSLLIQDPQGLILHLHQNSAKIIG